MEYVQKEPTQLQQSGSIHNMSGTFAMKSCKISDKIIKTSGRVKIFLVLVIIIFLKILDFKLFSEVLLPLQKFWTSQVIASVNY